MFKWLNKKLEQERNRRHSDCSANEVRPEPATYTEYDRSQLRIGISHANGGHIVTFTTDDLKTHRTNYTTYVIHDELDFNEELSKMITMETLKL